MVQSTFPVKPLAITMGDAAGIGPEIIAKAYAAQPAQMQASFVAGDVQSMRRATALVAKANTSLISPKRPSHLNGSWLCWCA
jgi:4-hydroxythreonine-4-phosphate dehydrogenase